MQLQCDDIKQIYFSTREVTKKTGLPKTTIKRWLSDFKINVPLRKGRYYIYQQEQITKLQQIQYYRFTQGLTFLETEEQLKITGWLSEYELQVMIDSGSLTIPFNKLKRAS